MALENLQQDILAGITREFARLNDEIATLKAENASLKTTKPGAPGTTQTAENPLSPFLSGLIGPNPNAPTMSAEEFAEKTKEAVDGFMRKLFGNPEH